MNGYQFTERTRRVLAMSREEAHRLHHDSVGTEHLLLGLIRDGQGTGVAVLRSLGILPDNLKAATEHALRARRHSASTGRDLPYSSRAKRVLGLAMAEARGLDHGYVGTEHLLLGLLVEKKGVAAEVLTAPGFGLARLRAQTLQVLTSRETSPESPASSVTGVSAEIRYPDGRLLRAEFPSAGRALDFLRELQP